MSGTRQILCVLYGLIAVIALACTWGQNLQYYIGEHAGNGPSYFADLKVNAAARSFTVDIGFFLLAATIWMVTEARKISIRFVWLYVIFGFIIAISVTFPLFMIAREMRLARAGGLGAGVELKPQDWLVIILTAAAVGGMAYYILT